MKHFIYYQYYLYYKRSKYDWKISPEESACWALGFSFFFPLFNFCAFIFLCILHEINYHWYYLIPFNIGRGDRPCNIRNVEVGNVGVNAVKILVFIQIAVNLKGIV